MATTVTCPKAFSSPFSPFSPSSFSSHMSWSSLCPPSFSSSSVLSDKVGRESGHVGWIILHSSSSTMCLLRAPTTKSNTKMTNNRIVKGQNNLQLYFPPLAAQLADACMSVHRAVNQTWKTESQIHEIFFTHPSRVCRKCLERQASSKNKNCKVTVNFVFYI